jgi:hypothetical protein
VYHRRFARRESKILAAPRQRLLPNQASMRRQPSSAACLR